MKTKEQNLWWGYKHVSGTYQVKRYFDVTDLLDAKKSDFCEHVAQPFLADNREDALKKIKLKF